MTTGSGLPRARTVPGAHSISVRYLDPEVAALVPAATVRLEPPAIRRAVHKRGIGGRLLSILLTGLLLAAGLATLGVGVATKLGYLHIQTVLSNSMQPTFSAGDVVVTQAIPLASVQVGDVITFVPPDSTRALIHRVTAIRNGLITTRGDANNVADPWEVKLAGPNAYRLAVVVPFIGWLTELQRPALLLGGLLMGLAVLIELRKEVRARKMRSQPQLQA